MKLLIDSHILIWLLLESKKLSTTTRETLESADSVQISMASLWELTIKYSKGKLKYSPGYLYDGIDALCLEVLPIKPRHILGIKGIRLVHGDPFDQLLIAQSEIEGCTFLTADKQLLASKYRTIQA